MSDIFTSFSPCFANGIIAMKLVTKMGYVQCAHYKQVAEKFGRIIDVIDYQKML
jgi:hypothetical protein